MRPSMILAFLVAAGCSAGSTDPGHGNDGGGETGGSTGPTEHCLDPGPDAPVTIAVTPDQWTFEGFPVVSYVPPNPKGLIVYFHGGATAVEEVLGNEQTAMLWNQMTAEGFGIVATQRTLPGPSDSWDFGNDDPSSNDDLSRILDLWGSLVDTTDLTEDTPVAFTGFSDGSGMAASMGAWAAKLGLNPIAVTIHDGSWGQTPKVPTQFHVGQNDSAAALAGLDGMVNDIEAAGVDVDEIVYPERPITPECFERTPKWDLEKGQEVFDDLVASGMIDEDGNRLVPDDRVDDAITAWTSHTSVSGAELADQRLHVMWATHRYSAVDAVQECRFILDALP